MLMQPLQREMKLGSMTQGMTDILGHTLINMQINKKNIIEAFCKFTIIPESSPSRLNREQGKGRKHQETLIL